ncbi:DNA gyrase inhibitor YacG [Actibacterium sp. 188UL27-1]|uniref:DNA gyrase inhibitor YacG n=1 Tax=Actibacterium sp. 188UL27-1 TaxID=2786961 RepID=UPI001957AFB7|nr:DNA gyrase inhibitor YacG [Actibacterium sp. 188UL27-1]MBM7068799.1 DNA gyrase inhibitor YacG [Actibacterium sp. 188UL27-1]
MTCPICKKATEPSYRPFCSKRCADVDLGRWMSEAYVIATDEPDPDESAADRPQQAH